MADISKEIKKLQANLYFIRKAGRWTQQEFGEILGLSKQSISSLEHDKVKMSKAQYIAIRAILDYFIKEEKRDLLKIAVNLCLYPNNAFYHQNALAHVLIFGSEDDKFALYSLRAYLDRDLYNEYLNKPTDDWMSKIRGTHD